MKNAWERRIPRDYNIKESTFTFVLKEETNSNIIKVQDAKESIKSKDFHIQCLTGMWTRKESKL